MNAHDVEIVFSVDGWPSILYLIYSAHMSFLDHSTILHPFLGDRQWYYMVCLRRLILSGPPWQLQRRGPYPVPDRH